MNRAFVSSTIAALLCTAVSVASAQQAFKTPDEAAAALVSAAKAGDAEGRCDRARPRRRRYRIVG